MTQFSKDKNIPIRSFTADETKNASGLNGPKAIADDIDIIIKMFDPEAEITFPNEDGENETVFGGIGEKNLNFPLKEKIDCAYNLTTKDYIVTCTFKDSAMTDFSDSFETLHAAYFNGKNIVLISFCEDTECKAISTITGLKYVTLDGVGSEICSFNFDFKTSTGKTYALIVSDPNVSEDEVKLLDTTSYSKEEIDGMYAEQNLRINKAEAIAKGRATGYVFDTVEDMNNWLSDSSNVDNLVFGDSLFIVQKDVPDFWWDGTTVRELESQKVDLTEYAKKSNTLKGYGITDAYNNEEVDGIASRKTEETVLYEDVLNTPEWTNQPTYEGTLDSAFNTTDFYYVTLKDVDGNALPEGKFMLKSTFDTTATVYPTVFALADLNTGTSTLVENFPVEFTAIDTQVRMRNAGVWKITYTPENWKLNGNRGRLRLVCDGQFIQRTANAYFVNMCSVNKNVSHYHSMSSTAFQNDATKQIICYAALSGSYKTNKFYDDMVIERVSDTCYATKRNVTIRYIKNASSDYTVSSCQVFGHGEISADTRITELCIQVAADSNRGFIRNGSVIRVTEVK